MRIVASSCRDIDSRVEMILLTEANLLALGQFTMRLSNCYHAVTLFISVGTTVMATTAATVL